ncbi:MAG: sigma 54-interacting transcriptional regulator [Chitinispirillaceae bacterium]|nr:sigma 54-interacting transcriptional regulator [Chitinispirillaceae bacterium]
MNHNIPTSVPALERESDGSRLMLTERLTTIGSSSKCRLILSGAHIPAHLAHIVYTSDGWTLSAINRTPPIYCNGQIIGKQVHLSDGDVIVISGDKWVFRGWSGTDKQEGKKTPLRRFVDALSHFARTGNSDARFELLSGIAQLLAADGARLVAENSDGEYATIARYPLSSGLDRFSKRAIAWARERESTVLMHETDWALSGDSQGSLELNRIGSVLCGPLFDGKVLRGYLYIDRYTNRTTFTDDDRSMLDDVRPVFGDLLTLHEQAVRQRETIAALQKNIEQESGLIVFDCAAMREAVARAATFGATDSTILVTGETGTGKELFASYLHNHSNRSSHKFCAINCGALPENLIEAELFGHTKGAFTDAHQGKKGLFERAHGGTVFLDEIGEMPLNLQVKLLRVLQESEVLPLGAVAPVSVDLRIVAATNKNLAGEVAAGRFREDLFYRLNVLEVTVPPLRDRNRDVLLLAHYFIKKYAARFGLPEKGIALPAQAKLLGYLWPGNVRQLENVVQKALLVSKTALLLESDFDLPPMDTSVAASSTETADQPPATLRAAREAAEKQCIMIALKRSNGNITVAAKLLETDRKWLTKLMKQHDITAGPQ